MVIGCINLVELGVNEFVGIQCSKGRGIILPGGKWNLGEDYEEAATRELLEETGLVATRQELLWGGFSPDLAYVYTFLTSIKEYKPVDSSEGKVVRCNWSDLFNSFFRPYYKLLQQHIWIRGV